MPSPTIEFAVYDATTAGSTTLTAGSVMTLDSVSAGSWTSGKAFRVHIFGNVGVPSFDLGAVHIWFNDAVARYNNSTDVNLGDRYSASGTHHWSARLVQAAGVATSGLVGVTALQTSRVTCPPEALTAGSWMSAGNASTANGILIDADLAASFKGDSLQDGSLLHMSVNAVSTVWSRHIGVSFRPSPSAADGVFTDFGLEVGFDFS